MTNFASILDQGPSQDVAHRAFQDILAQSAFHTWIPGNSIPLRGTRVLIGVGASFSLPDLALLDQIHPIVEKLAGATVEVFDASDVRNVATPSDFEKFIPGIGKVFHTPVIGVWSEGKLIISASGYEAREFVKTRLHEMLGFGGS